MFFFWIYYNENKFNLLNYLITIGDGTQNLIKLFLILLCNVFSSKNHVVCSFIDAPAVGSGAPLV